MNSDRSVLASLAVKLALGLSISVPLSYGAGLPDLTPPHVIYAQSSTSTQPASTTQPASKAEWTVHGLNLIIDENAEVNTENLERYADYIKEVQGQIPAEHLKEILPQIITMIAPDNKAPRHVWEALGLLKPLPEKPKVITPNDIKARMARREKADQLVESLVTANAEESAAIEMQLYDLGEVALVSLKLAQLSDNFELRQRVHKMADRLRWRMAAGPELLKVRKDLLEIMTGEDQKAKSELVDQIVSNHSRHGVSFFAECMGSDQAYIRQRAVEGLRLSASYRKGPAVKALQNALADPDRNVRLLAIAALSKLRAIDPESLRPFLSDTSLEVRSTALLALGQSRNDKALPILVAALSDPEWRVRSVALEALDDLVSSRDKAKLKLISPAIMVMLNDPDPFVRKQAFDLATDWELPAIRQHILAQLKSGKMPESEALELLANMRAPEAAQMLKERYTKLTSAEDKAKTLTMLIRYDGEEITGMVSTFFKDESTRKHWGPLLRNLRYSEHLNGSRHELAQIMVSADEKLSGEIWQALSSRLDDHPFSDEIVNALLATRNDQQIYRALYSMFQKQNSYRFQHSNRTFNMGPIQKHWPEMTARQRMMIMAMFSLQVQNDSLQVAYEGRRYRVGGYSYVNGQKQYSPMPPALTPLLEKSLDSEDLGERITAAAFLILQSRGTPATHQKLIVEALNSKDKEIKLIGLKAVSKNPKSVADHLKMNELMKMDGADGLLMEIGLRLADDKAEWWPQLRKKFNESSLDFDDDARIVLAALDSPDPAVQKAVLKHAKQAHDWDLEQFVSNLQGRKDENSVKLLEIVWKINKREQDQHDLMNLTRTLITLEHESAMPLLREAKTVLEKYRYEEQLLRQVKKRLQKANPEDYHRNLIKQMAATNRFAADRALLDLLSEKQTDKLLSQLSAQANRFNISPEGAYQLCDWLPEAQRQAWLKNPNISRAIRRGFLAWTLNHPGEKGSIERVTGFTPKDPVEQQALNAIYAHHFTESGQLPAYQLDAAAPVKKALIAALASSAKGQNALNEIWKSEEDPSMQAYLLEQLCLHLMAFAHLPISDQSMSHLTKAVKSDHKGNARVAAQALYLRKPDLLKSMARTELKTPLARMWRLAIDGVKIEEADHEILKQGLQRWHGPEGQYLALAARDRLPEAFLQEHPAKELSPEDGMTLAAEGLPVPGLLKLLTHEDRLKYYMLETVHRPLTLRMGKALGQTRITPANVNVITTVINGGFIPAGDDFGMDELLNLLDQMPANRNGSMSPFLLSFAYAPEKAKETWLKRIDENTPAGRSLRQLNELLWNPQAPGKSAALNQLVKQAKSTQGSEYYSNIVELYWYGSLRQHRAIPTLKNMLDKPGVTSTRRSRNDQSGHRNWIAQWMLASADWKEAYQLYKDGYPIHQAGDFAMFTATNLLLSAAGTKEWDEFRKALDMPRVQEDGHIRYESMEMIKFLFKEADALSPSTQPSNQPATLPSSVNGMTSDQMNRARLIQKAQTRNQQPMVLTDPRRYMLFEINEEDQYRYHREERSAYHPNFPKAQTAEQQLWQLKVLMASSLPALQILGKMDDNASAITKHMQDKQRSKKLADLMLNQHAQSGPAIDLLRPSYLQLQENRRDLDTYVYRLQYLLSNLDQAAISKGLTPAQIQTLASATENEEELLTLMLLCESRLSEPEIKSQFDRLLQAKDPQIAGASLRLMSQVEGAMPLAEVQQLLTETKDAERRAALLLAYTGELTDDLQTEQANLIGELAMQQRQYLLIGKQIWVMPKKRKRRGLRSIFSKDNSPSSGEEHDEPSFSRPSVSTPELNVIIERPSLVKKLAPLTQSPYDFYQNTQLMRPQVNVMSTPKPFHGQLHINSEYELQYMSPDRFWFMDRPTEAIRMPYSRFISGLAFHSELGLESQFFVQFATPEMEIMDLRAEWMNWIRQHSNASTVAWRQLALKQAVEDLSREQWWYRARGLRRIERLTGARIEIPNLLDQEAWKQLHQAWSEFEKEHGKQAPRHWIALHLNQHAEQAGLPQANPKDRQAWREHLSEWLRGDLNDQLKEALLIDATTVVQSSDDLDDVFYWYKQPQGELREWSRNQLSLMLGDDKQLNDEDALKQLKTLFKP